MKKAEPKTEIERLEAEKKALARRTRFHRSALGISLATFWGAAIYSGAINYMTDSTIAVLGVSYFCQFLFTGMLAKKLNRSPAGWIFGSLFTSTISSIVLLAKKRKVSREELLQARRRQEFDREKEKLILTLAREQKGFVTPGQVALAGDISLDEAKAKLEELAAAGHAQVEVSGTGTIKYYFPEFAPDDTLF